MAKCRKPKKYGIAEYPCLKCPECLERRQRSWLLRMLLESYQYETDEVTFLTLTYAPENLPEDADQAKRQVQLWLKRLRKELDIPIRYVAALEVGEQGTRRFHWHVILYGFRFTSINKQVLRDKWANGFIDWKPSTPGRMSYVLKYVIKGGKFLMSRKPGIGALMLPALQSLIDGLRPEEVSKLRGPIRSLFSPTEKKTLSCLRAGGYDYPVHRYLKERLLVPVLPEDIDYARYVAEQYRRVYGPLGSIFQ